MNYVRHHNLLYMLFRFIGSIIAVEKKNPTHIDDTITME